MKKKLLIATALFAGIQLAQAQCPTWLPKGGKLSDGGETGWVASDQYLILRTDFTEFESSVAGKVDDGSIGTITPDCYIKQGTVGIQAYEYAEGFEDPKGEDDNFKPTPGVTYPIHFYQTAFAPQFETSGYTKYHINGLTSGTALNCNGTPYAANNSFSDLATVADRPSIGYAELCRNAASATDGSVPSLHGWMEIRNLTQVERVNWSYSSTGSKRGIIFEYKIGEGQWKIKRFTPSNMNYALFSEQGFKFTDLFDEENISLRWRIWEEHDFTKPDVDPNVADPLQVYTDEVKAKAPYGQQQVVRIHDIKIYSSSPDIPNAISEQDINPLRISCGKEKISFSEVSNIDIFSISGQKIIAKEGVKELSRNDLPKGFYVIKAKSTESTATCTEKLSF